MPKDSKLKLFRVLVSTHRTDYLVTNELGQDDSAAAEAQSNVRWLIEQFHREAKQLTGVQACQCRLVLSQRSFSNKNEGWSLPLDGKTNHTIRPVVG